MQHLNGAKIKNLQVLIKKKELEKESIEKEFNTLQSKRDRCNNQLKKYQEEISKLKDSIDTVVISEHAIIRYLQRVYELDLEKIEKEILTPELQLKIVEFGNGTYEYDGFRIKLLIKL
ncbi:MAG: hypothetical protein Q9M40_08360 [Sulfurimonas sp.]|nr:hypothetical protein [Sulfurimonas sp.]